MSGVSRSSRATCSSFTWGPAHAVSGPEGTLPLRSRSTPPCGRRGPLYGHTRRPFLPVLPGTAMDTTPPQASQPPSRQVSATPPKPPAPRATVTRPAPLTREDGLEEAGGEDCRPRGQAAARPAPPPDAPPPRPHLLPLELLALAQELNEQARALQVVPQPLPVL